MKLHTRERACVCTRLGTTLNKHVSVWHVCVCTEELSAVYELHSEVAGPRDIPVVVFNGELDRLRGACMRVCVRVCVRACVRLPP